MAKRTRLISFGLSCLLVLTLLVSACAPATTGAGGTSGDLDANQEYRANINGDPPSLDPNASAWDASIAVISLVYRGLLSFKEDLTLQPAVAKEVPSTANGGISADGKTYTLKLRTDVKWSDGKLVTAKDFEYSVKRLLDPKLGAEYASFYYGMVGAEAYNTALGTKNSPKSPDAAALAKLRDGVGVKATDDATLQFALSDPRSSFLDLLALHAIVPVRQDIVEAKGDKWYADPASYIGNGPFVMTEYLPKDHITLAPNPNFYGNKPKLKKVTLLMVEDINANYAAYLNSERDITMVPSPNVPVVMGDPALKDQVVRAPRLATYALQFNNKVAPFDNVKVRKAFSMAIDRVTFIDKVRRGVGKPAFGWIPPGMPGYQADLGKEWGFDAAKAKQLLADAGFPDGKGLPPTAFQYSNTANNQLMAVFIQAQFKDNLGLDVKLEPMESAEFSKLVSGNRHMMGLVGWVADYPDPDNWLPELFGSKGGNNHTQYTNPQLDALMQKAITESDPAKRLDMWAQAQKMVVDDLPMAFLFHDERFVLVKPYVKGLKITGIDTNALTGNFYLDEVYLLKH
ncbi:MAG: peptide ABC transporter substrate-binding protein [Dehalococcoidia bacterium]|nr:peptide ABC transporter substrate-binding protein [Dehalococcoidia bacterium]